MESTQCIIKNVKKNRFIKMAFTKSFYALSQNEFYIRFLANFRNNKSRETYFLTLKNFNILKFSDQIYI